MLYIAHVVVYKFFVYSYEIKHLLFQITMHLINQHEMK